MAKAYVTRGEILCLTLFCVIASLYYVFEIYTLAYMWLTDSYIWCK